MRYNSTLIKYLYQLSFRSPALDTSKQTSGWSIEDKLLYSISYIFGERLNVLVISAYFKPLIKNKLFK